MSKAPVRVLITGAAGQIGYSVLPLIAGGKMLGSDQPIILHLLDIPPAQDMLNGVVMELEDGAYDLLHGIVATTDIATAFKDIDYALLIGAFPRKQGMERKDLLERNAAIFQAQGKALDEHAKKTVKVLVVGNPANTNCLLTATNAPSIPRENFTAMTRLDHNRALAQLAKKAGKPVSTVSNVTIWGNHSATQFPDLSQATIGGQDAKSVINDDDWINNTFIPSVQKRGAAVIAARKLSSAMSAANAAVEHMRDWVLGTPEGVVVSMGVFSDGSYDIEKDIVFSFPVTCKDGKYSIVMGRDISDSARQYLNTTLAELKGEKADANV